MQSTILVIFGITGDLSKRYILPAISEIAAAGKLSPDFKIIGVSRREVTTAEVLQPLTKLDSKTHHFLADHLEMFTMRLDESAEYERLKLHLHEAATTMGAKTQILFYLSVPPQFSQPIVRLLGEVGLATGENTKLLLEKPFGVDLTSAQDFIAYVQRYFKEEQVYRIDHYLAKEMAQNLIVFRSSNTLFKKTWNHHFIEQIDIIASESIGIEGRAAFYEQTGALRDIVQSHLLQLAALTLMDLNHKESDSFQAQRLAALKALRATAGIRGQYKGYAEEVDNPGSTTETFTSLTLQSSDPNWQGVPITLTTGKALDEKATEIRIHYRREHESEANELVLRIQPEAGIEICLWSKKPGYDKELQRAPLHFIYDEYYDSLPDAYEQVLVDAMRSDHSLFASSDEVLESWRILSPVQHAWSMSDEMIIYEPGSSLEQVIAQMVR